VTLGGSGVAAITRAGGPAGIVRNDNPMHEIRSRKSFQSAIIRTRRLAEIRRGRATQESVVKLPAGATRKSIAAVVRAKLRSGRPVRRLRSVPRPPGMLALTSTARRRHAGMGCGPRIRYDQIAIGRDVETR
jgi:hypothetical protein